MPRQNVLLLLDPQRWSEQLAYISARETILHWSGDRPWVSLTEDQASRFQEQGIGVVFPQTQDKIETPAVSFQPSTETPTPPAALSASEPSGDSKAYYIVHFSFPPDGGMIQLVLATGATWVQELNYNAAIVAGSIAEKTQILAQPFIDWVGLYHPAYALDFQMAGRSEPFTAPELSSLAVDAAAIATENVTGISIEFFDDIDAETKRATVEATGAVIKGASANGFVLQPDPAVAAALLVIPGVYRLTLIAAVRLNLDRSRRVANVDAVNRMENLHFLSGVEGNGERLGLCDNGLDHSNPASLATITQDIRNRVLGIVPISPLPIGSGDHGTHVTGIMMGDGTSSDGKIKGMAPQAHVFAQVDITGSTEDTIVTFLRAARNQVKALNNSWGSFPGGPSTNVYGPSARDIDRFAYLYPEMLIVFASGNDEQDTGPGGGAAGPADGNLDMDRLGNQSRAKNILTVGANENVRDNDGWQDTYRRWYPTRYTHANFDALAGGAADGYTYSDSANQLALFSNRGPINSAPGTATGRLVPHLVAPGTNIIALRSSQQPLYGDWRDPRTVTSTIYTIKHGTSMAAPHATGAAALCRQFYRTRFGQLRRPAILDSVPPTSTPPEQFVGLPAAARLANRHLFVWVRPQSSANDKELVGALYDDEMIRLQQAAPQLIANVGDQASPRLAVHDNNLYLLHRHGNNELQLHKFVIDPAAATFNLDNAWNGGGSVVVTADVDMTPERPPALTFAEDHLAVAWFESGQLNFRRYAEADGSAVDGAPVAVGAGTAGSDHNYLIHSGSQYALAWLNNANVEFRIVDNAGNAEGTGPLTVRTGDTSRVPHLVWDNLDSRFVVIWDEAAPPREKIFARGIDHEGALLPDVIQVIQTAEGGHLRRPFIDAHSTSGFILGWEDDAKQAHYDVYFTFLNAGLQPDNRIPVNGEDSERRRLSLISDTPQDTSGFAVFKYDGGFTVAWNSLDEINNDSLSVAALGVRPDGHFFAQTALATPLIAGGNYVNHELAEHGNRALDHVSIVWAGGDSYQMAWEQGATALSGSRLVLTRTNPDGLRDTTYGAGGSQLVSDDIFDNRAAMLWDGRFLFCLTAGVAPVVRVYDNLGRPADGSNAPVAAFGANGTVTIDELTFTNVTPQLGSIPQAAPNQFRAIIVYGTGFVLPRIIRYAVLDTGGNFINLTGGPTAGPIDLVTVADPGEVGTARHGWFHYIHGEGRSTAIWHERPNPATAWEVRIRQFNPNGGPFVAGAPIPLLTRNPGDTWEALNANLAARQQQITGVGVGSLEYAVAWQHRPAAGQPYEIRFSRLQRNGTVAATHNVRVVFPSMTGTDGVTVIWPPVAGTDTDALSPQIVCTHSNEDINPPPAVGDPVANVWNQWAPGYGLAWLGRPTAGGNHTLYVTVLNENGTRLQLERPAPQGRVVAEITKISDDGADVKDFHLMWNGRSFRLSWTEERNNRLYHMQTGLTRHGSRNVFFQSSAALLKATLISGATNISHTALPNLPSAANINDGYGWGRLNVRQSLAPAAPVTMQVRDDAAVGNGRSISYRFRLPPRTVLLRVTLTWTDPPGANVVNQLNLRVTASASGNVYHGNQWDVGGGNPDRSAAGGGAFDANQTVEQVVLANPPAGEYVVEVIGQTVTATVNNAFPAQPFALTFVGSGPEAVFGVTPCDRKFY